METVTADASLQVHGRTITTFAVYDAWMALRDLDVGQVLALETDAFKPFESDVPSWCDAVGHRLITTEHRSDGLRFLIEKGGPREQTGSLAMIISVDGLLELLSPLGFALAAGLEGLAVRLYFQGPAVKVLSKRYRPRMRGWSRPFSRFAASGLTRTGHIPAQEKLRQLRTLGAEIYLCGPSMAHFKVTEEELIFDDLPIVEYLTFMAVMRDSDVQLMV